MYRKKRERERGREEGEGEDIHNVSRFKSLI